MHGRDTAALHLMTTAAPHGRSLRAGPTGAARVRVPRGRRHRAGRRRGRTRGRAAGRGQPPHRTAAQTTAVERVDGARARPATNPPSMHKLLRSAPLFQNQAALICHARFFFLLIVDGVNCMRFLAHALIEVPEPKAHTPY